MSVAEMAAGVRSGELSARRLVAAHLERSRRLQEDLNAFTLLDEEGAMAAAGRVEQVGSNLPPGPLAGVPVGLKDLIDQAGLPTTCGSRFYRQVPAEAATVVRRLERAGAVITGRLGLHEFAFGFSSENPWWGAVHNPWNRAASPGGSSGGSAAATAAGLVAASVGTDTGGSVRVPAALCGLVGLKVTHGRIPLSGVFPLAPSLDTVGPLARSVEDAALLYRAMAGYDPTDPWSVPLPPQEPASPAALEGSTLGVPQPWVESTPLAEDVAEGFGWALDRLADAGAEVRQVRSPVFEFPGKLLSITYGEAAVVHRRWFPSRAEEYGPDVAERLSEAGQVTLDEYVGAQAWRSELRNTVDRLLAEELDYLVTPATAVSRKLIAEDLIEVAGETHHYRKLLSAFSAPVNHMGLPALVAPLLVEGEPPPAIQLVGPRWGEESLIAAGRALEEAALVGFRPPPRW